MSPQRTKIDWEPNIPVTVTLEFDGGKEVAGRQGPQYLYWVDGQRSMFLDPQPHDLIQQTGAKAGDTLEITKTLRGRKVDWEVVHILEEPAPESDEHSRTTAQPMSRVAPQRARGTAATSQPAPRNMPASTPAPEIQQPITGATLSLTSALCNAVDALLATRDYARSKGIEMPITADAIRAVAISVYIDRCKGGSR